MVMIAIPLPATSRAGHTDPTPPARGVGRTASSAGGRPEVSSDRPVRRWPPRPRPTARLAGDKTGPGPKVGGRPVWARWALLALALLVAAAAALAGVTWAITPSTADALARVRALDHAHHTTPLPPDGIPPRLAAALIAVEDANFYQDHGISVEGLGRAALYDLVHRCTCQGGSTITQQLAEDLYLHGDDASPWLRWVDIVLAVKLESHLSKAQILAAYASEVDFGHGTVGAAQASEVYFHRPLSQLTLAQDAMLAGLPQAPSAYDPLVHPGLARLRRDAVLAAMREQGLISAAQARRAASEPV
jgi:membrane peptidoglycan carboxypeptidase